MEAKLRGSAKVSSFHSKDLLMPLCEIPKSTFIDVSKSWSQEPSLSTPYNLDVFHKSSHSCSHQKVKEGQQRTVQRVAVRTMLWNSCYFSVLDR